MTATPIVPYTFSRATPLDLSTAIESSSDSTNGNSILNSGNLFLDLHNTDASPRTCAFTIVGGADGQPVTPLSVSVAATKTVRLGPFPTSLYGGTLNLLTSNNLLKILAFTVPTT
jgi:hypothetical protein